MNTVALIGAFHLTKGECIRGGRDATVSVAKSRNLNKETF